MARFVYGDRFKVREFLGSSNEGSHFVDQILSIAGT
jgi:hypothetical protein